MSTVYLGTGRRKTSTARVRIFAGSGKFLANDLSFDAYFKHDNFSRRAAAPLTTADAKDKFDVIANIAGGGTSAQAGAVAHGIARALLKFNAELRVTLKKAGHLPVTPAKKSAKSPASPAPASASSSPSVNRLVWKQDFIRSGAPHGLRFFFCHSRNFSIPVGELLTLIL